MTAVVHGLRWPDASARDALRVRLQEACPGIAIVEAREDPAQCIGAAAVMARAVAAAAKAKTSQADGRLTQAPEAGSADAGPHVLLFLEPSVLPAADDLRALVTHASRGLAIEDAAEPRDDGTADASADLLSWLAMRGTRRTRPASRRTPVWAVSRAAYEALGGVDPRLWSIFVVEDLIARAEAAGVPVARVALTPAIVAPPAYPLRPAIARLLAVRNPLLTALKTAGADDLGIALAAASVDALRDAWRATGLDTRTFDFGGSWGRGATTWQSLAQTITGRSRLDTPLRDPDGCLLPLLAIDSVLDEVVPSRVQREAWQRVALSHGYEERSRSHSRHDPDGRDHAHASDDNDDDHRIGTNGRANANTPTLADDARTTPATDAPASPPSVSVIVVNWNGREHLRDCFGSLHRSDYPADRLECICVDNGSTDGSVDLLRQEFPHVKVVALDRNTGFTGGNEAGVAAAAGDVLVFLNNDMRVEPDCLRELVGALDAACACAGARVLSWDGRRIDFVRGSLNFEARGFQDFYNLPNLPELATPADTFFPNGGAFAVTRDAYDRAGGFDPTFFAYYDDVDLGWRLRLTGTTIRVAGRAVVYHRHGATSRTQPRGQKRFLMDRNATWTLMKNYGETALRRTLGTALVLAIRRILDESRLDRHTPLVRSVAPFVVRCRGRGDRGWTPAGLAYEDDAPPQDSSATPQRSSAPVAAPPAGHDRPSIRGLPLEALGALGACIESLPQCAAARAAVQRRRTVPDREILPRFGRTLDAVWPYSSYKEIQHALMEAQELEDVFRARTRLLIITHEALARHISGPAVRVLEMGRALASVARVTIATPAIAEIDDPRCTFAAYDLHDGAAIRRLAEDADAILIQGFTLHRYPFLDRLHVPIIVDLYCPFTLEHLEQTRARLAAGADADGRRLAAAQHDAGAVLAVQNEQLLQGDFFICASEAQRDFWLGALHTQGRINPLTYGDDPTLRRLIDVVPFGLPEGPIAEAAAQADAARGASRGQPVMKGVWPGLRAHDRVLLWAGSLLDWQDPLTLIRAVAEIARTRDDVKLVFMGTRHPNPMVSPMQVVADSRALAAQLGLLDTHVFFNDWVPYDQRALFLREADLGLSTHRDHAETHFSFRTRMLDYIWAGLPIVCTRGDFFASLVEQRGLGLAVPPGDAAALAAAIASLLDDGEAGAARRRDVQAHLEAIRDELRWSRMVAPLARYCTQPSVAADRAPDLRAFRQRLADQYRGSKRLKRLALRLGLSEFQFERLKQSSLGRAALSVNTRLALHRAKRRA